MPGYIACHFASVCCPFNSQKAIELDPKTAIYHYNLAMAISQDADKLDRAIPALKEAMKLEPMNQMFYVSLANLCFNVGDYKNASKFYRKGVYHCIMWGFLTLLAFVCAVHCRASVIKVVVVSWVKDFAFSLLFSRRGTWCLTCDVHIVLVMCFESPREPVRYPNENSGARLTHTTKQGKSARALPK